MNTPIYQPSGMFVKACGKRRQLYHHPQHGYGFFDDTGNFIKHAYTKVKDFVVDKAIPVYNHLREHKYANSTLAKMGSAALISIAPEFGVPFEAARQKAADAGFGRKGKGIHVPMVQGDMSRKDVKMVGQGRKRKNG